MDIDRRDDVRVYTPDRRADIRDDDRTDIRPMGPTREERIERERVVERPVGATPVRRDDDVVEREYVTDREYTEPPAVGSPLMEPGPRFSLGATFLGWSVASFFTLVFVGIAAAILGGIVAQDVAAGDDAVTTGEVNTYGIGALVGVLIAVFLAYLIGGYAAGRISLWNGAMHGALTVAWAVLLGILAFIAGATLNAQLANYFTLGIDPAAMDLATTGGIVLLVLSLLAALLGGALGGKLGERYHKPPEGARARRPYSRGRPL